MGKKANEHEARIRALQRADLLRMWASIEAGDALDWPAGKAFEYLLVRAFELEGATVRWPYEVYMNGSQLEQIDGAIHHAGLSCLVETKEQGKLNMEPIAKMRNQLLRRPAAALGSVFSMGGFTEPARVLASFMAPQVILLWEKEEIKRSLEDGCLCEGLMLKYRFAVEEGIPDYNLFEPAVSS